MNHERTSSAHSEDWNLEAHAIQFGRDLLRWRRRAGWAQDTSMSWGREAGIPQVFSSTWSMLENARMTNPGPKVFLALADQNQRIAAGDFEGVTTRALMDRLKAAEPVTHEDGEPWDAADFFACYIGLQPWPHPAIEPPQISDEDAATWTDELRGAFQSTADQLDISPVEAMVQLLEHGPEDRQSRQKLQRVLLGFEAFRAADLLAEWRDADGGEELHPVNRWRAVHGLAPIELTPPWA